MVLLHETKRLLSGQEAVQVKLRGFHRFHRLTGFRLCCNPTNELTHTALAVLGLLVALLTETLEGTQSVHTESARATQCLIEAALIDVCETNKKARRCVVELSYCEV